VITIIIISAKWTEWNWQIYTVHSCLSVCLCVCVHSVLSLTVCVPPATHQPSPSCNPSSSANPSWRIYALSERLLAWFCSYVTSSKPSWNHQLGHMLQRPHPVLAVSEATALQRCSVEKSLQRSRPCILLCHSPECHTAASDIFSTKLTFTLPAMTVRCAAWGTHMSPTRNKFTKNTELCQLQHDRR